MKKLYLIRHGESEWNNLKKVQGQRDILLTNKGKKQAEKIANRLYNEYEDIDIIYSSDLKRAFETAKIIGKKLKLDVIPDESFREIKFGIWEGLSIKELDTTYHKERLLWLKEPHNFKLEGAETLQDLQKRAMKEIDKISKLHSGKNVLIVSHSAIIKTIILGLLDMDIHYYAKMSLGNVSLSIIEFRDFNNVLTLFNDTCHLREEH